MKTKTRSVLMAILCLAAGYATGHWFAHRQAEASILGLIVVENIVQADVYASTLGLIEEGQLERAEGELEQQLTRAIIRAEDAASRPFELSANAASVREGLHRVIAYGEQQDLGIEVREAASSLDHFLQSAYGESP